MVKSLHIYSVSGISACGFINNGFHNTNRRSFKKSARKVAVGYGQRPYHYCTNVFSRLGSSHNGYRRESNFKSKYEKMCRTLPRRVRFGDQVLPSISREITVESLRTKSPYLNSKDIEHLVLLLKGQTTTLRNEDLTLGPKDAPMMDLISKSGTCFPIEVKTTFSTCTEFPVVPVNQDAVPLMMEKHMHPHGLVVAVNSRTLEFWIFKANEDVHVNGTTDEEVPRFLVVPTDKPLERGRFVL